MSFLDRISSAYHGNGESRANDSTSLSMQSWQQQFRPGSQVSFNGRTYQAYQTSAYGAVNSSMFENNSIVYACEAKRINVFCEAGFKFQRFGPDGRPGDLFGTPELKILEEPWPGATMRDLLAIAELDVATSGNSYWVRPDEYLHRLQPQNITILTEAVEDPVTGNKIGRRLLGYAYREGSEITHYGPEEVAHYKPIPNSTGLMGLSWMASCFRDIDSDDALTEHKRITVRNGANLRTIVSLDSTISTDEFKEFVELFHDSHEGPENSGKTLFLGGGADVRTVSQSFSDLALGATQGATETRIAACSGVHPVVAGLSEGMKGSSLNAGNYAAAKRSFVDGTMRPLWGAFAQSFQYLVKIPVGARLWYDDRDIPFLREDIIDQATIMRDDAGTISLLTTAGFEPDAIVKAITARDLTLLTGQHTGLYSVQLQPPGTTGTAGTDAVITDAQKKALPQKTIPDKGNGNGTQSTKGGN